jgi:predicted dithiol-disulfide oxidoreductase (DUF899 family)
MATRTADNPKAVTHRTAARSAPNGRNKTGLWLRRHDEYEQKAAWG